MYTLIDERRITMAFRARTLWRIFGESEASGGVDGRVDISKTSQRAYLYGHLSRHDLWDFDLACVRRSPVGHVRGLLPTALQGCFPLPQGSFIAIQRYNITAMPITVYNVLLGISTSTSLLNPSSCRFHRTSYVRGQSRRVAPPPCVVTIFRLRAASSVTMK